MLIGSYFTVYVCTVFRTSKLLHILYTFTRTVPHQAKVHLQRFLSLAIVKRVHQMPRLNPAQYIGYWLASGNLFIKYIRL